MRVLLVSTPVGPLGSGLGGGVELTLTNIAKALVLRGHAVGIIAPKGSQFPINNGIEVDGALQITAQVQGRGAPITLPANSVLENMWTCTRDLQQNFDVIINFAYDWLPFYLTPWFHRPIAHLVSMGSLTDAMDEIIGKTVQNFPGTVGVHSLAQAATFEFGDRCRCLSNGLDLSGYTFQPQADRALAWVGRIAPEKGIEDAIAAAAQTQISLRIFGIQPDLAYWQRVCQQYPQAPIDYRGFLPTHQLQQELGQCAALVMTPRWVEAFGNVAMEALACGVPVVAYRRGGPAEIVQDGVTGWLVEPDSVAGLVAAIARLDELDRHTCRQQAEASYSLEAMGGRVEQWLKDILTNREAGMEAISKPDS
ncbi:MAG: glycosyltransferase family 4 protein [Synechococcales bacterium]|nr:glycosyltransferase family 4 protein [Synechococcales bacterium]